MNKSALVTGGARRIGREIAIFLAKLGYNIALHYHTSQTDAQKTADDIKQLGKTCEIFKCDLKNLSQTEDLIRCVTKVYGKLDILINNAAVFDRADIKNSSTRIISDQFDVNVKAPYILTRDFANHSENGLIINMIDKKIDLTDSVYSAYTLSKKALADLTSMSALQLAPKIRVNGIALPTILPEKTNPKTPKPEKNITHVLETIENLIKDNSVTGEIIRI